MQLNSIVSSYFTKIEPIWHYRETVLFLRKVYGEAGTVMQSTILFTIPIIRTFSGQNPNNFPRTFSGICKRSTETIFPLKHVIIWQVKS
jgi:hypothetical protein